MSTSAKATLPPGSMPVTCVVAVRNEASNIGRCVAALSPATRILVVDSGSTDGTVALAEAGGAEVVQFRYPGGYPKKRQWALEHCGIDTDWVMLIDADEEVPPGLWEEIDRAIAGGGHAAYLAEKRFHFLGRRLRWGGFSHSAVVLMRRGAGRFEELVEDPDNGQDMEVHERVLVTGSIGRLSTPLLHNDFKGLTAYIDKHNHYATWEARVRYDRLQGRHWGDQSIRPNIFGGTQERRRFLKDLAMRLPGEPAWWFAYHYFVRLGVLEGRRGLIAALQRATYVANVRAKIFELSETGAGRARPVEDE